LAGLSVAGSLFFAASPVRLSASGYEFDGIGAKAVARGGAVIADDADWTAIYWNPAGLTGVKAREAGLELRGGYTHSKDGNSFNIPIGGGYNPFDKTHATAGFVIGSLGAVFPLDDSSAIGAGVYTPLLQGADFKDSAPADPLVTSLDYQGSVILGVANFSYARKLTDKLSGGLGVNAIYGSLSSDSTIGWGAFMPGGLANVAQKSEMDGSGYGVEAIGGLTYEISDRVKAGVVARSGARIRLQGQEKVFLNGAFSQQSDFTMPVHQPATTGFGFAWLARADTTITVDLAQTWWKAFSNTLTYDTPGGLLNNAGNTYHWKNSYKYRLGVVRKLSEKTEIEAGYAYDTPAIDSKTIDFSTAIDVPMHRFSAAITHRWSPFETTLGALAGAGRRTTGGVDYALGGWYVIGEARYRF
jgi:long-chain fatty acid transport protein